MYGVPDSPGKKETVHESSCFAPAFYPGKEQWKSEPSNRYTAEQLREMERNWEVEVRNPDRPHSCRAD